MSTFAYADETVFYPSNGHQNKAVGCGILICQNEISQNVISEALNALQADPDIDKIRDARTLQRQYFHASDDSKNAHSHLCRSITKNVNGIFDFSYFQNITSDQENNASQFSEILGKCLSQCSLEFFHYPNDIVMIVEKRQGLSIKYMDAWRGCLSLF